eukprot:TRINITY_DN51729_c0_g2_i1.p1 TRINITY_DN51729_c0_g2~~TRINITY_DN51729_c0_g2_i1.p1  ORF type:complete len:719 (+),score=170.56 TRINITY_DN51729_c0_g2_i1:61-2217(+)
MTGAPLNAVAALDVGQRDARNVRNVSVKVLLYVLRKYCWEKRGMVASTFAGLIGMKAMAVWLEDLRKGQRQLMKKEPTRAQTASKEPFSPAKSGGAGTGGDAKGQGSVEASSTPHGSPARAAAPAKKRSSKASIKVDSVFARRLLRLLPVLVPKLRSKESLLLVSETAMLVARSLLSIHISELIGQGLQAVMHRSGRLFVATLSEFFISGLLASFVNSSLKYMTNVMSTWFRENLTLEVHRRYMHGDSYYRASLLSQSAEAEQKLDNLDQRIVADVQNFTKTLADLYSRTFKPALDVLLCTRNLAKSLGLKGPLIMYGYFVVSTAVLRVLSPPLAKMVAQQQATEGDFRRSHARLLAHSEEVAFIDGSSREEAILNDQLLKCSVFSEHLSFLQFKQGVADSFGLKYFASCVGWPVIALPFILNEQTDEPAVWMARYRVADDLIRQGSAAFGDLMLVHKKLQTLSGFTARVSELLETLDAIRPLASSLAAANGKASHGTALEASKATIETPDGRRLLTDLTMKLSCGDGLLVTGPNGAGKTSFFRTVAGLWSCTDGWIHGPRPAAKQALYLPQQPYLMLGSLRDQIVYPKTVEEAVASTGGAAALDVAVEEALKLAGMERFAEAGLDVVHSEWNDVLSGGEKQRMGWARLFFHSPAVAFLDEATSAINVQQEGPLYQAAVDKKITLLSIAHRPTVRQYHKWELNVTGDGSGQWSLSRIE